MVDLVGSLPQDHLVLDGEVLALRADGGRNCSSGVLAPAAVPLPATGALPLRVFFFGVMRRARWTLLDEPLGRRLTVLGCPAGWATGSTRDLCRLVGGGRVFADTVARGLRGGRRNRKRGAAGRRDSAWVTEARYTLSVVTAASGDMGVSRWLSIYHPARDPARGGWICSGSPRPDG